ncbi:MAG: hypothetical protein MK171_01800 [Pirellulales bacterium]|nr:hypothetical protein [Pirellulales bacterium]
MRRNSFFLPAFALLLSGLPTQTSTTFGQRLYVAADVCTEHKPPTHRDVAEAASLYQQARVACEQGDVGAALKLVGCALAADPDHAGARRVLGYGRSGNAWAGRYAARRLERGEIWHPEFGWIWAEDRPRWEAGERRLGDRWISESDDNRRHKAIAAGWQIRTDHFRVVTNHSRQAAAQLATRLECLYQIWQQQFGGFFLSPAELLKRFDGKETSGYRGKPFQVVYYRNREQYNEALRRQQPRIEMTLGIYFDTTRETHFFSGDDQDAGTIYHEAIHQFFQESVRSVRSVGGLANAWIIEGVACYFESLVEHGDAVMGHYYTLGTAGAGRLPAARHRLFVDEFYLPLAELCELGMTDFQRRDDLARLYSQAAGLATFLMHYQEGRYRTALVEWLKLIYTGGDKISTLCDLTGRSFDDLDREYRKFLEQHSVER